MDNSVLLNSSSSSNSEGDFGSFVAIGSFLPSIEIWNLDEIDPLEPVSSYFILSDKFSLFLQYYNLEI